VSYPDPDDCILKFTAHNKQHNVPFYLVCDFESFLQPVSSNSSSSSSRIVIIDEHQVSGFACYRVTDFEEHKTDPTIYSGPDVMTKFYEHVMRESEIISSIMAVNKPMINLTEQEKSDFEMAVTCANCGTAFTAGNKKVRHHCHISGRFLSAVCNNCNLQLKMTKRAPKQKRNHDDKSCDKVTENDAYFLAVVFHNMKSYDGHFVVKHFQKKYTENRKGNGTVSFDDIKVIPVNSEKYMMFEIGNLRFLDSFQFLPEKLETLVSLLLKSGKDKFRHTVKHFGSSDLVFAKGVYPYSYMTSREKFADKQLPPSECFYNSLTEESIDERDYARAQQTWSHFKIENMQQYHDHYLLLDVLLLTDVLECFRSSIRDDHQLDFLHFYTLPSLSWTAALKHTGVELQLLTDPDAYLMIENSMRGGIAVISHRHAVANNEFVEDYDPSQPKSFLVYLDANSLYPTAMCESLPVGDFRFLSSEEIENFDLDALEADSAEGFILEVDLKYPENLHVEHNDYPMAAEHLTVTEDMLSPFALSFADRPKPCNKLVPNLRDKIKYVTHYRNLQFYKKHGLIVTKIHRILSFKQRPWLKPYIDHCTARRQAATSQFESDLNKMKANAVFGKSMECVRNRVNIRLIADPQKLAKAVSKVSFRQSEIINPDLVMVRSARQRVLLNKPIYTGFAILELSKLIMYRFFYDFMKVEYPGDRCRLLFTDTDSLCCWVQTDNLYADIGRNLQLFDTSNFEPDHPQYSAANRKVLGKFKSETGAKAPKEFVGLRAKMYSLYVGKGEQTKMAAKGIKKSYVKKHMQHDQFLKVLYEKVPTKARFRQFRSVNHVLQTVEIEKLCLNAFDDKRYVLMDGVRTLAYGHKHIECVETH
jgi:hypothetical protein